MGTCLKGTSWRGSFSKKTWHKQSKRNSWMGTGNQFACRYTYGTPIFQGTYLKTIFLMFIFVRWYSKINYCNKVVLMETKNIVPKIIFFFLLFCSLAIILSGFIGLMWLDSVFISVASLILAFLLFRKFYVDFTIPKEIYLLSILLFALAAYPVLGGGRCIVTAHRSLSFLEGILQKRKNSFLGSNTLLRHKTCLWEHWQRKLLLGCSHNIHSFLPLLFYERKQVIHGFLSGCFHSSSCSSLEYVCLPFTLFLLLQTKERTHCPAFCFISPGSSFVYRYLFGNTAKPFFIFISRKFFFIIFHDYGCSSSMDRYSSFYVFMRSPAL